MQRLKHLIAVLMIALSSTFILMPAVASADFKSDACAGVNALNDSTSGTCSSSSTSSLDNIIKWVVNILSVIVGFAAVIMVIVGGFRFITSGGDSSNTAAARNTILYALVGLVIVALAQVIVHFVLRKAVGGVK